MLSADWGIPSVIENDDQAWSSVREEIHPELVAAIVAWNEDYQPIVPLDSNDRLARRPRIEEQDRVGLWLAGRLEASLGVCKVEYHSEGELRRLPRLR